MQGSSIAFFVFFAMAKGEARTGVHVSFFMVFEIFCPQDFFCKSGVLLLLLFLFLKSECMHACNAQMMQDLRFLRCYACFGDCRR